MGPLVEGRSARVRLKAMSCAVTGSPLLKRAFLRMVNQYTRWFLLIRQVVRSGTTRPSAVSLTRLAWIIGTTEMPIVSFTVAGSSVAAQVDVPSMPNHWRVGRAVLCRRAEAVL